MLSTHVLKLKNNQYESKSTWDIGDHILATTTVLNTSCFQFYPIGPLSYNVNNFDIDKLLKITHNMHMYVHATHYTSWNNKAKNTAHIIDQLNMCIKLRAYGLVIHLPKALPHTMIDILTLIKNNSHGVKLLLEVRSIRACDKSYETLDKLTALIDVLKTVGFTAKTCGIVIDTAHIYASQVPIRTYTEAQYYIEQNLEPINKWIDILHLNGNAYNTDIKAGDKHCTPFSIDDCIWGANIDWLNPVSIKQFTDIYQQSGVRAFYEWYIGNGKNIICEPKKNIDSWYTFIKTINNS